MRPIISARWFPPLALGGFLFLNACSIQEPELPVITTEWVLPLGTLDRTVAELIEDEEGLEILEGDVIALYATGELDSVAVADRLDLDVDGTLVEADVGTIELEASDPATFAFTLSELAPGLSSPVPAPVPPFPFDVSSGSHDLPGFTYAEVSAGTLEILLDNGLPVPVGGDAPPEQIEMRLQDASTGAAILSHIFPSEIAAGASAQVAIDLAGTALPDSLVVALTGGSAGSGGNPVAIDPDAVLLVEARVVDLSVDRSLAPVPFQSFTDSSYVDLADSVLILSASVATGELGLRLINDLRVPVDAHLVFPDLYDDSGAITTLDVPVPASGTTTATLDLANHTLDFGGGFGERLLVRILASTPGSGGGSVWIHSTDRVTASVLPTSLGFQQITGALEPHEIEFDAASIDLVIPDELESIRFAGVELAITMRSTLDLPGFVDFQLMGRSDGGEEVPFAGQVPLPDFTPAKNAVEATVIFDQDNSDLLRFLNNLPVFIETAGTATIGDGVTVGTVSPRDGIVARYELSAPLTVSFGAQTIELDSQSIDLGNDLRDAIKDYVVQAAVEIDATSSLPVAVDAWLHLDPDPARVENNPRIRLGPIVLPPAPPAQSGQPRASVEMSSTVSLDESQMALLTEPQLHQAVSLELPGTGGAFVTLRSTDRVDIIGRLRATIQLGD